MRLQEAEPPLAGPDREQTEVARVEVQHLRKEFRSHGSTVAAVDGVSLTLAPSEMLVLLGPSGCGKTTLLRAIAGLERPDGGEIWIDGRQVYSSERRLDLAPERRGLSFVFQSYALWPHMRVLDNVIYPLRAARMGRRKARALGEETLDLVGCQGLGPRYPSELSGGQQQRVAVARAIIAKRGLIFFDEPLSNIDAKVREKLRLELLNLRDRIGFAGMYVTHDQDEAMILGDRIAVMCDGNILQIDTPARVYEAPKTRWVADFIGMANFIDCEVEDVAAEVVAGSKLGRIVARGGPEGEQLSKGQEVVAFFRPERARVVADRGDGPNWWECSVIHTMYFGGRSEVLVDVQGERYVVSGSQAWQSGDSAWLHVPAGDLKLLTA
jgi:iron(III) transport system ATP-binding protein